MALSFRQAGNLFIAGPNISIYPSGNTYAISGNATSTGSTGFSAITSAGTGQYLIASSVTNNNLIYKSITGSSNLSIDDNNDTLIFSRSGGGIGTIISGINIGTDANSIGIFTGLTTITNPNDTLAFRNLLAGDNITVALSTNNDGDILVDRGPAIVVNQISNVGGGARVLTAINSTNLILSGITISGGSGISSSNPASQNVALLRPTNTQASRLFYTNSANILGTDSLSYVINSTADALGIGQISVSNVRLTIGGHAANYSVLRLTPFATPYSESTDGDIWYTSSNDLKFNKGAEATTDFIFKDNNNSLTGLTTSILFVNTAGTLSTKYLNSFGIFNSLSSLTISNITSETSIISSLITGSTTLLASTSEFNPELGVGRKYRFNAKGTINTGDNVNLTIRIKLGSTVISSSSTISVGPIGDVYSSEIEIDATFTVRNSQLIVGSGKIIFLSSPPSGTGGTGDPIIFGIYSTNQTITTTANQVFDCTAQFGIADPSNIITINESTLELLN